MRSFFMLLPCHARYESTQASHGSSLALPDLVTAPSWDFQFLPFEAPKPGKRVRAMLP